MYARIAKFEGMDRDHIDESIEAIRQQIEAGFESPPEGLEGAKEEWALINRDEGQGLAITLFETEDELRRGHEALDAMSPPDEASSSRRTDVAFYEVALRMKKG